MDTAAYRTDPPVLIVPPDQPRWSAREILAQPEPLQTRAMALPFRQGWRPQPEPGFRPATVWLGAAPDRFLIYAELQTTVGRTTATADQQRLWTLGDVFEVLVQCTALPGYHEFQVAPNGCRLQLRYPQFGLPLHLGVGAYLWPQGCLDTAVACVPGKRLWRVAVVLPAAPLLGEARDADTTGWRIAFCRYDYDASHAFVLSATPPFQAPAYHRKDEWHRVTIPGGFSGRGGGA